MTRVKQVPQQAPVEPILATQEILKYEEIPVDSKTKNKQVISYPSDSQSKGSRSKDAADSKRRASRQMDGVDMARIKELGFPVRLLFEDFIQRYKIVVFSPMAEIEPTIEHCRFIIKRAGLKEYEIGENKVFLSYADAARLNYLRREEERKIVRAQAYVRGYLVRSRSKKDKDENLDVPEAQDFATLTKKQFNKLVESSSTSTLSTLRSFKERINSYSVKSKKGTEQSAAVTVHKKDKGCDSQRKRVTGNLEQNFDTRVSLRREK